MIARFAGEGRVALPALALAVRNRKIDEPTFISTVEAIGVADFGDAAPDDCETPAEVSQYARRPVPMAATLRGMPQVLVRIDSAGKYPVVVDDGEGLLAGDGARWRYVCDVGSVAEGHRVCAAWLVRRQALLRSRDGGSNPPAPTT